MASGRNPFKRIRQETQRTTVERGVGMVIFTLGPSGEGSQFAAADVDENGNIKETALFDIDKFDEGMWGD